MDDRTAADKHRETLLLFMGDPENDFPNRKDMALSVLKYKTVAGLYKCFTIDQLCEIEAEALDLRKRQSVKQRNAVYDALLAEAKTGNVKAIREYLDRTEGKVKDRLELSGGLSLENKTNAELDAEIESLSQGVDE